MQPYQISSVKWHQMVQAVCFSWHTSDFKTKKCFLHFIHMEWPTQACVDLPSHAQRRGRQTLSEELQHIVLSVMQEITFIFHFQH